MSILKAKNEENKISAQKIKELIAHDLGIDINNIQLNVDVEFLNGESYFNDRPIEKAVGLIANISSIGKNQTFNIDVNDLKQLFEKYEGIKFSNESLSFNYQQERFGPLYELIDLSIHKKLNQNKKKQYPKI